MARSRNSSSASAPPKKGSAPPAGFNPATLRGSASSPAPSGAALPADFDEQIYQNRSLPGGLGFPLLKLQL